MTKTNQDKPSDWPCCDHGYDKAWCDDRCVQWDGLHIIPRSQEN